MYAITHDASCFTIFLGLLEEVVGCASTVIDAKDVPGRTMGSGVFFCWI